MNVPMLIEISSTVVSALLTIDACVDRVAFRTLSKLIDRLPPYRPGGRYRSRSEPERYAALRRPIRVTTPKPPDGGS